ncbi:MAG: DUF3623 domain-containing protein [Deltaproteobacteria bacterium]|nr:DUF3623 domain-containing protein [Nannocystaceae bacterium]
MNERTLAIVAVVAAWWLSTGVVLRVVWLPRRTHRYSFMVFSVLALVAGYGLWRASTMTTLAGAYLGLGTALVVWAWHELAFLLGIVSGPRKQPSRPGVTGWPRFVDATLTVIHHELALAATALAVVAATWDAPNQVATGTFLVLWVMRLSAKLNLFFGVRALSEEFVPEHLRYLTSYFRRVRFNPLILLSLVGGGIVLSTLVEAAWSTDASDFTRLAYTLVASMLGLGLLEHAFLAVPMHDAALWRWLVRSRTRAGADPVPSKPPSPVVG